MASENIIRHKMPRRRYSDSILAETSSAKSNQSSPPPPQDGTNLTRLASKVRGISIDMSVVLGNVALSEKPNSYISPISVASSADQPLPPMRPRAPTSVKEGGATSHTLSPHHATTSDKLTSNRLNIHNAKAFAKSRRSKILAKVSNRISKIRDDKTTSSQGGRKDDDVSYNSTELASKTESHQDAKISNVKNENPVTADTQMDSFHAPVLDSIQECQTEESALSSKLEGEVFSDAQQAEELEIFVDEYPHDKFLSLLELLRTNKVIQKLNIVRNCIDQGDRTRRSADLDHLFHVLHILSNSLEELCLQNLRLQDLTSVSLGLYDHASIEHLQLTMESGTLDEETAKAIASLPQLVSLELEVRQSFPVWPLLDSKSLTILSVVSNHFVLNGSDVIAMADKLETNSTLQVLDLEPRIPAWCLVTLITALRSCQDSSVETFQFSCRTQDEKDGDACMLELIKLMKRPRSKLRVVWNHCFESFRVNNDVKERVMSALYVCSTLHQFHVFMESKEYGAIKCHVLERNMRELKATEAMSGGDLSTDDLYEL